MLGVVLDMAIVAAIVVAAHAGVRACIRPNPSKMHHRAPPLKRAAHRPAAEASNAGEPPAGGR